MNCQRCEVELKSAVRQGVEVDYCPLCRGVWLDRGELEKLIEHNGADPWSGPRYPYWMEGGSEEPELDEHRTTRARRRTYLDDVFDFG